ncbi:hypothetical protein ZIOFF_023270 [Zingiber officinale]|uniref:Acyl carrier protein n=1 Tax=Zingiber officinale TaxID=94328 RepID=A0A8J5HDW5_ZINOF|nr:hypothetical protein ZIOFF_023270 [Zingiber officinale]
MSIIPRPALSIYGVPPSAPSHLVIDAELVFPFSLASFRVFSVSLADRWLQSLERPSWSRFVRRGGCCRYLITSLVSNQFPSQAKGRALFQSAQHRASGFLVLYVLFVLCVYIFYVQAKPETLEKVCSIVKKQLALAENALVTGESTFVQLGADSLDTVEVVMGLEEEFGISVEEENAQTIQTVQDAADMIEILLEKKNAA